jgi:uncharacterized protein (TIGR03032 family)
MANFTKNYTQEASNVASQSDLKSDAFDYSLIAYNEKGDFFAHLEKQNYSLCVSREYEHFVVTLDGQNNGEAWQSVYPLPHPSGLYFRPETKELILSSTRTPNIIFWFSAADERVYEKDVVPENIQQHQGQLFLPQTARFLPGTLYIHDVIADEGGDIYATITGHNFLAKITKKNGWERVWWPEIVDNMGRSSFDQNYLQLNSVAWGGSPEQSFYTAFSNSNKGYKPWKEGYGPDKKGVVFSGKTRNPLVTGLTCPHSAKLHDGKLWVCNSGYGSIGYIDNYETHDPEKTKYVEVAKLPGFTRGMAFAGDIAYVGLSKVIEKYEPYAPGLKPAETRCAVYAVNIKSGEIIGAVDWPTGYQIYDIQIMQGVKKPLLPLAKDEETNINNLLRYLG